MVETDENLVTKVSRTFVYETDDDDPDLYYNADRIADVTVTDSMDSGRMIGVSIRLLLK